MKKVERVRHLDALLALLDSPNEGDEVLFTLKGNTTKYRGVIKKKSPSQTAAIYKIVSKSQPTPQGVVETIEYKGRVFKSGGEKSI